MAEIGIKTTMFYRKKNKHDLIFTQQITLDYREKKKIVMNF